MAVFKAIRIAGKLEIETLSGDVRSFDIKPTDIKMMQELEKLKTESGIDTLISQFSLFCIDFDSSVLEGIPSNTLEEMIQYVVDVSSGKKRSESEKKSP